MIWDSLIGKIVESCKLRQLIHALGLLRRCGNSDAVPVGKIILNPPGILQNRQRRVGGTIAVAGIEEHLLQFRGAVHGTHHVDFAVTHHFHQGDNLGIQVPLYRDIFIVPVGVQTELLQIVYHISGIISVFIQIGDTILYGESHANHGLLPQSGLYRHGAGNTDARNQRKPQDFFDSLHGIAPSLFQYGIDCLPRRRYNGIAQFVSFKLYQIKVKNANPIWKNRKIILFLCTKIIYPDRTHL